MKFTQSETTLGSGSRIVRYKTDSFEVNASAYGMVIKGELDVITQDDLSALAEYISRAWKHHKRLKNEKMESTN